MSWFDSADTAELKTVSEGLLNETVRILRASSDGYEELDEIKGRVFPPGVVKSEYRSLVQTHLRSVPIGAIEVSVADGDRLAIGAKDRVVVKSQADRLFEVIAPLTARTIEIRRKLIVREINLPDRELYLALKPEEGYDGANVDEVLPILIRVLPVPYCADKPIETISEGQEVARLKQVEVSEIALDYLSEANRARHLYCLLVHSDITPTAAQARDRVFPRYRFNGSPTFENHQWSSNFPWSVALIEEK